MRFFAFDSWVSHGTDQETGIRHSRSCGCGKNDAGRGNFISDRPDPEGRKSRSQGCVSGYRGAAHWYQTPLHFYLQTPIAQIHDYSMAQFEHWTKETFSANFRKMLTLEQYRDPKLAQLHHDYLAGGPLKYMAVIFRKLADSDETAMQLALEFYL